MTERKQVQKSHWVNNAFVFEVLLNLRFERVDVGEQVSMREAHAFWLGGSARSENDLGSVAVDDFFHRERLTRINRQTVGELFKHQPRESQIRMAQSVAAVEDQLRFNLLLYARREFGRAFKIERHNDDASQETAKEASHPFGAAFRPKQDPVAFQNIASFELARELKGRRSKTRV